ncbi:MAG: hypothetical protein G01um1014106_585 [Parcubacteria group bacterium Gr01-1014_106]|nr:MAG: hypothetical protein G01um1014106_585 [Parcubacteria group bacterium Gr01-1014_106]
MKKRVVHNIVTTIAGAFVGGIVVFWFLSQLGKDASPSPAANPVPVGTPGTSSSATAGTPTPSATPVPGRVSVETLGIAFVLPPGYRIAQTLNSYDAERVRATPRFTITTATAEQEKEYVALLRTLGQEQSATEAPEFSPGKTITLARAAASDQAYAQRVAKQQTTASTDSGITAKRYQRVEGPSPYDVTFLLLPNNTLLSVTMTYASGSTTPFDEDAYSAVLRTVDVLPKPA